LKAGKGAEGAEEDKGDKGDKGEKTDFFVVLIVSTHLWIQNLHLSDSKS
jgi:hypothetical protein